MSQTKLNSGHSQFIIYRSSAGSGKTYKLALEFVCMVLQKPNKYNRILAVTFTNKATAEMKERILDFLLELSSGKGGELMDQVSSITGMEVATVSQRAKQVNRLILHNYSLFSVSTIDAFFQKIVKSFARELGLLGSYELELDQDKVKQEVIDMVMEELGSNTSLTNWLVDYSFYNVDENRSWDIRPEIEKLAREVFRESFRPIAQYLQQLTDDNLKAFIQSLQKQRRAFEQAMKILAKNALKSIASYGLVVDDFSYKASGPAGYFQKVLAGNYEPPQRLIKALGNPELWSAKKAPRHDDILQLVHEELGSLAGDMEDYYQKNSCDYLTASAVMANVYAFGILKRIADKISDYRQQHDVMLISDVAVFLNEIIADADAPFIYEKTGTWYQHFLIDEFQDTSFFQWQNFKPLIENALSSHEKSLLVGDGKQSIYRWRGGDWELILRKAADDLRTFAPQKISLDTNRRSEAQIILFNNAIYTFLPGFISRRLREELGAGNIFQDHDQVMRKCEDIVELYKDSKQIIPDFRRAGRGYVTVNVLEKNAQNPWTATALDMLPGQVEQLQEQGFAARDIAILVRKGAEGKQVMEALLQYKTSAQAREGFCYDAVSNESLYISNAPTIRLIISMLKYCSHPEDNIAGAEMRYNMQELRGGGNAKYAHDLSYIIDPQVSVADFESWRFTLLGLPVYDMIEEIIRKFDLTAPEHSVYLQAFQDLVLQFFVDERKGLQDFLSWWEDKGKKSSVQMPDDMNAIRVMTIHKSKGLQFGAVILPFCSWLMDHDAKKANIMWSRIDQPPYREIGYLPVKYQSGLIKTRFANDYAEEKIRAHADNLNLLYVATTRAKAALVINSPAYTNINHAGALLVESLKHIGDQVAAGSQNNASNSMGNMLISEERKDFGMQYTVGNPGHTGSPDAKVTGGEMAPYATAPWQEKIAVKRRATMLMGDTLKGQREKVNYGLLVHEILAGIQNMDDAKDVVADFQTEGRISGEEKTKLLQQLTTILSNPQVAAWFQTDWEVKTEVPVIVGDEKLRRPDRVLMHGKKAIIIDFKTGLAKTADQRQMVEYKSLLQQMGYEQVQGYLLYLSDNRVEEV